jgi:hypothetical protein
VPYFRVGVRGASRVRLREECARPDVSLEPVRSICFAPGAVGTGWEITEAGYALFQALGGAESVAQAVAVYAEDCGVPPEEVRRKVLDFVREGLARGLLEPHPKASDQESRST